MYGMSLQRLTLMRRLCWRKVRWASSMRVSVNRFGFLSVAPPLPEVYISAAYIPGRAVAEIYPMRVPGRSDRHGERITTMRYRIASSPPRRVLSVWRSIAMLPPSDGNVHMPSILWRGRICMALRTLSGLSYPEITCECTGSLLTGSRA